MTPPVPPDDPLDSAEELFERAPCGYLSSLPDGTIVRANGTLEAWLGVAPGALVGRRFSDLLTGGGRIYHETHFAPLLQMQDRVREIALEVVRSDGTRLPVLVNAALDRDASGVPRRVRTILFDASDRRRYEEELLAQARRERELALQLQRSLLAGSLPSDPAIALAVVYEPAEIDLEIGGDWYDAFWTQPGRRVALVVGDVVGRGLGAAATMGQLRSAARALIGTGRAPHEVLEALDDFGERHELADLATIVVAELDLADGALRFACAGHPPPVLVEPRGQVRPLWEGRSPPLGAASRPRPLASDRLAAGATLALYTDGLYERRGESLATGLERLTGHLADLAGVAAEPLAATIARRMLAGRHLPDDACLLVLRYGAESADAPPPGAPPVAD